jgi:MoxR-like ATPase
MIVKEEVKASCLEEFFEKEGFVIEKATAEILERKLQSERKAFLLRGPAGTGKTLLTALIAKYTNAEYVFFQCTPGTSEEDLLYKYIPSEKSKSGIEITMGPIPRALMLSKKKKTVLVLDEFDKTRPSADALLLDVLQNYRIALYLDNRKTVIQGNPKNLIIFLTSNDFREFSEPLLRRTVSINLDYLPPQKVYQILKKQFSEEISKLLTQIYIDTVNAGLRKPATVQELIELGEILTKGDGMDLLQLLKMFVIKYDDDLQKYLSYVRGRTPTYNFVKHRKEEESIEEHYIPKQDFEEKTEEQPTIKRIAISDLLNVLRPNENLEPAVIMDGNTTALVSMKADNKEMDMYDTIVKVLQPKPPEDPAKIGKFEVWKAGDDTLIVSKQPLSFSEFVKLFFDARTDFEMYAEDTIKLTTLQLNEMNNDNGIKVLAYSKRLLRYQEKTNNNNSIVLAEITLDKDYDPDIPALFRAKIKIYAKRDSWVPDRIVEILKKYHLYVRVFLKNGILIDDDPVIFTKAIKEDDVYDESALNIIKLLASNPELRKKIKMKLDKGDRYRVSYSKYSDLIYVYVKYEEFETYKKIFEVGE